MIITDEFTLAYIEAALWSSTDENDEPLDSNYCIDDLSVETLTQAQTDCTAFQEKNAALIGDRESEAGHDFWLTRNGHGAGFWDGDWPKSVGEKLSAESDLFGEIDLYVGDDGKIYA